MLIPFLVWLIITNWLWISQLFLKILLSSLVLNALIQQYFLFVVRLDLETFILSGPEPTDHTCLYDQFYVTGGSIPTPTLCGTNNNQHSKFSPRSYIVWRHRIPISTILHLKYSNLNLIRFNHRNSINVLDYFWKNWANLDKNSSYWQTFYAPLLGSNAI